MGLLGLFGKKKRTNSVGEKLDRLTPEGELPFGWMVYNQEIIEKMEAELETFRKAINEADDPLKKYAALKSYLLYLEDGKKRYTEINECAGKYFAEYICDSAESEGNLKWLKELEKELMKANVRR